MQFETDQCTCPTCGSSMTAGALVVSCGKTSRWWQCENPRCRVEWLLPSHSVVVEYTHEAVYG